MYNQIFSMKPTLKKVSKYENKFAKLQKKAAEFNFRNQLKQVKKKEFTLEEEDKEVRKLLINFQIAISFIVRGKIYRRGTKESETAENFIEYST